jgi:hypothetical protein
MITSAQYTVGTSAVKIAAAGDAYRNVTVHQNAGSIYLGGSSGVTTSTGMLLDNASGPKTFQIGPQDELWAISSASHTVSVLVSQ